jgi:hypothetical protein
MLAVYHFSATAKHASEAAGISVDATRHILQMAESAAEIFHTAEGLKCEEHDDLQVDEVCFGGRKYHKGKRTNSAGTTWYLTIAAISRHGVKKKTRKVFSYLVPDRTSSTLLPLIKLKAGERTRLWTDGWKAYCGIRDFVAAHETVNHAREFKSKKDVHTNNVESSHSQIKRLIRRRFRSIGKDAKRRNSRIITATVLHNSSLQGLPEVCGLMEALRWCIWN